MKFIGPHIDNLADLAAIPGEAAALGATAFAFCPVDPKVWFAPAYPGGMTEKFVANCLEYGFSPRQILPHASLLLNLCSPDARKLKLTRDSLTDQVKRVRALGLDCINVHPGSHIKAMSEDEACTRIAESVDYVLARTEGVTVVLENMAGQGSSMGYSFNQLATIIDRVSDKNRVAVCIDSCHAFAAGYDMATPEGFEKTWKEFADTVGFDLLRGMHINDSVRALGSRVDRHASLGRGELGSEFFAMLMADQRFDNIPLILETPDPALWQTEVAWLKERSDSGCEK